MNHRLNERDSLTNSLHRKAGYYHLSLTKSLALGADVRLDKTNVSETQDVLCGGEIDVTPNMVNL